MTGSSTLNKTVTKQLIDANYETKFDGGWKWMAYPFSEYTDISPSGYVPAGNNHNMIAWRIRNATMVNQLMGESDAAVYIGDPGSGTWHGSFTFKISFWFLYHDKSHFATISAVQVLLMYLILTIH